MARVAGMSRANAAKGSRRAREGRTGKPRKKVDGEFCCPLCNHRSYVAVILLPAKEEQPSRYDGVFSEYRAELDARHDKHERLVKLSRDTTIHSKRAIFLLHRAANEGDSEERRELLLDEGEDKIREVFQFLRATAEELHGSDPWRHASAFSPGLQEFVEALSYYVFLRQGQLLSVEEAQQWMSFAPRRKGMEEERVEGETELVVTENEVGEEMLVQVPLSELNYVLAIGDLTGELMRMCITAVGAGQQEVPFQLLPFIRAIYCGFHSLPPMSKEILHKLHTLRSSMSKIESACYTLRIRGSEIPHHTMSDVFHTPAVEAEGGGCSDHFDSEI